MSGPTGGRALSGCLVAGVLLGSLVACTSGAGSPGTLPSVSPPPSTSPTGGASPSPSPSSEEAAIEAAVRHYFDAVNSAISTGDTSALDDFSTSDCPCRKLAVSVERIFSVGASEGAAWTIATLAPGQPHSGKSVTSVVYTTSPYRNVNVNGKTLETFPGYRIESAVLVVKRDGVWRVRDFDTLTKAEI